MAGQGGVGAPVPRDPDFTPRGRGGVGDRLWPEGLTVVPCGSAPCLWREGSDGGHICTQPPCSPPPPTSWEPRRAVVLRGAQSSFGKLQGAPSKSSRPSHSPVGKRPLPWPKPMPPAAVPGACAGRGTIPSLPGRLPGGGVSSEILKISKTWSWAWWKQNRGLKLAWLLGAAGGGDVLRGVSRLLGLESERGSERGLCPGGNRQLCAVSCRDGGQADAGWDALAAAEAGLGAGLGQVAGEVSARGQGTGVALRGLIPGGWASVSLFWATRGIQHGGFQNKSEGPSEVLRSPKRTAETPAGLHKSDPRVLPATQAPWLLLEALRHS